MSKRKAAGGRHRPGTPATPPETAAARWQSCPFAKLLDQLEVALHGYKGVMIDLGPDAHGSIVAPLLLRLYDRLDAAAAAIGEASNPSKEVWPGCPTIDDVWNSMGEGA